MSRVRGMAPWAPYAKTVPLLENVNAVFEQYREQLPLTIRQVFYRLVAAFEYEKTENGYGRLVDTLNRARRAQVIPFSAIRRRIAEHMVVSKIVSPHVGTVAEVDL